MSLEEQLKQLKRENELLESENEFLKALDDANTTLYEGLKQKIKFLEAKASRLSL